MDRPIVITRPTMFTSSIETRLTGVEHNEIWLTHALTPTARVPIISSNFGSYTYEGYVAPPVTPRSNRGRKPKPKDKSNRKIQGDGTHFNSQVTFKVLGEHYGDLAASEKLRKKIYHVRLFRNGKINVPGALRDDQSDVNYAIDQIVPLLQDVFEESQIERTYTKIVVRDAKCNISDPNWMIDLEELKEHLTNAGDALDIISTKYNPEQDQGLIVHIRCKKSNEKVTLKVFSYGKINLDSCNKEEDGLEIIRWFTAFINECKDKFMHYIV